MHSLALIPLLGFKVENKKFPTNQFPMIYSILLRQQSSGGVHTFEDREQELCSCTNIDDEEHRSGPQGRVTTRKKLTGKHISCAASSTPLVKNYP
jgi:hypothetical protein